MPATATLESFGGKGDGAFRNDGSMAISPAIVAHTLNLTAHGLTSADVGKAITVKGAGAGGAFLNTTISAVPNANSLTLTAAAATAVNGTYVAWGTGNFSALQQAIASLSNATGFVVLNTPGALYFFDSTASIVTTVVFHGQGVGILGYR